jgi:hypothetical protein
MRLGSRRGLSLTDALIAVAGILVMGLILAPMFLEKRSRSRVSRAKMDLMRLSRAAEAYAIDYAGEYPSNHNLNFDFRHILVPLSTPVAYIATAHLPDVFGNIAYPDLGGHYIYFFFNHSPEEELIQVIFNQSLGYSEEALNELTSFEYVIISTGPDKIAEFHWIQPPFGTGSGLDAINHGFGGMVDRSTIYDPTNGAASKGDIVLTHRGFLDDVPPPQ